MNDTRTAYERLMVLAAANHGWFSSTEAHEVGIDASLLSRMRSRGTVVTPRRNRNRLVAYPVSWESEAVGALMVAGPPSALGRYAALRVHERRTTTPSIDVVVPRSHQSRSPDPRVRTHVRLTAADVTVVEGFRVTEPAFTVCDLAAIAPFEVLMEVTERFMADGRLAPEQLRRAVHRFRAVKGVETLRELVDEVSPSVRWTRSDGERVASRIIRQLDLPAPAADHEVVDADGRTRFLDFAWPELKLAVEIDLHPTHGTTIGRRADGLRQNALVTCGWTVLRFDLADLMRRPEHVAATILRAYAALTN